MTTVNNAVGVYNTLGYNFSDPNGYVQPLSNNTLSHLNSMPPFIETWQAQDILNNNVGGYFQNPVANSIISIGNSANSVLLSANSVVSLNAIVAIANTISSEVFSFLTHTNNLSGVNSWTGDNTVPYYQSATSVGRIALYVTNQTDGISNTSPVMGSFGSILIGPQLSNSANTLLADANTIIHSINTGRLTSNLTSAQIIQITQDFSTAANLFGQQSKDVTFFNNVQNFITQYNSVKQFSNLGESQSYLLNNFIGTPKLQSRINS